MGILNNLKTRKTVSTVSYAETVENRSSLDNMARTENNEQQNATKLSQETEIGTTVIREELPNATLPIEPFDL